MNTLCEYGNVGKVLVIGPIQVAILQKQILGGIGGAPWPGWDLDIEIALQAKAWASVFGFEHPERIEIGRLREVPE